MNDQSYALTHIISFILCILGGKPKNIFSFFLQTFSSSPSHSSCVGSLFQSECYLGRIWSRITQMPKTGVTWQTRRKSGRPGLPWRRSMDIFCQTFQRMNCITCCPWGRMFDSFSLASLQAGSLTCRRRRFWNPLMRNFWNITVHRCEEK